MSSLRDARDYVLSNWAKWEAATQRTDAATSVAAAMRHKNEESLRSNLAFSILHWIKESINEHRDSWLLREKPTRACLTLPAKMVWRGGRDAPAYWTTGLPPDTAAELPFVPSAYERVSRELDAAGFVVSSLEWGKDVTLSVVKGE